MKKASTLHQTARWFVVIAATIALVVAFSLPAATAVSYGKSDVAWGRRGHCGGHVHRHRRVRSCYSGCGTGGCYSGGCATGGCTVGGCTTGGCN